MVTIAAEIFENFSSVCGRVSSLRAELTEKENLLAGNSVSQTIRHVSDLDLGIALWMS